VGVGKKLAAACGAWICFEDEAGQTLRPPKVRTWSRRGHTPEIAVSGKGSGRISIAGLVCLKPGARSRLIYRTRLHRGRKGERRSFAESDYAALLDAAHQQLHAPIVLVWDNLNTHISAAMRALITARDWLHVIRLPAYAPDLNPTEHVWSHLKRSLGNLAVQGIDHLATIVKNRLKRIQYRPELTDAFFAHTGLTLDLEPP
jgi:DDE superfamily endonuclease